MDRKLKVTSGSREQFAAIAAQNLKDILADARGRFSDMSVADARDVVEIILDHSTHEKIAKLAKLPCRR